MKCHYQGADGVVCGKVQEDMRHFRPDTTPGSHKFQPEPAAQSGEPICKCPIGCECEHHKSAAATPVQGAAPRPQEFEHEVDRRAQEMIDANPGSTLTAAYRAIAMQLHSLFPPATRPTLQGEPRTTSGYVQEVRPDDAQGPSCHVCGAIMARKVQAGEPEKRVWDCLSCGATTGCS